MAAPQAGRAERPAFPVRQIGQRCILAGSGHTRIVEFVATHARARWAEGDLPIN